jgi:GTPase SAR1 family protein
MSYFGQIVIGPPGSGKTTYIKEMKSYYNKFKREVITINLDPANECNNNFDIDIRDLITIDDIGEQYKLGPNASFLYVYDFLEKNIDWLTSRMKIKTKSNEDSNEIDIVNINNTHFDDMNRLVNEEDIKYYIFDTPGQTEIFCLSNSFKNIIKFLTNRKTYDVRLCCVNLIESNNLDDLNKYIFSVLSVLNSMLQLELPQINVISKFDMIKKLDFPLSFYLSPDTEYLKKLISNKDNKYTKLSGLICDLIGDFSLVAFTVLDVNNPKHINKISCQVDKANGYYIEGINNDKIENYLDQRNYIAKIDLDNELNDEDLDIDDV